jgi:hypothetical protein
MAPPVQGTDDGNTGYGVQGTSGSGIGIEGIVGKLPLDAPISVGLPGSPVTAATPLRAGVVGYGRFPSGTTSGTSHGVYGDSISGGDGVYGSGSNGVHGFTSVKSGYGVLGENTNGTGVCGVIGSGSGHPQGAGLAGIWGDSTNGNGVLGSSANWNGVEGDSWSPAHAGVAGQNNNGGPGVWGSSTGNAGQFEGNVLVTGNITVNGDVLLANADCAEDFDIAESGRDPGTVVVIDEAGILECCSKDYDKRVAGVVSGAGRFQPGIILDRQKAEQHRKPVALVGKVYCKVDAGRSPIEMGDLLTTSDTPGYAMRVIDRDRAFGAVIGKALGPLKSGRGVIPILVALQ